MGKVCSIVNLNTALLKDEHLEHVEHIEHLEHLEHLPYGNMLKVLKVLIFPAPLGPDWIKFGAKDSGIGFWRIGEEGNHAL